MDWSYPEVYVSPIALRLLPLAIKANDWVTKKLHAYFSRRLKGGRLKDILLRDIHSGRRVEYFRER